MHRKAKEVSLILVISMVFSIAGCAKKQKDAEVALSSSETTIVEVTTESTTETTIEITTTTEERTSQTTTVIESSETTVTESSDTEPSEVATASVESTKESGEPKSTPTPEPTKAPATPTPVPTATPVPTSTPTPTTAPKVNDPGLRKSTAISAAKAAVQDCCGSHSGFEFNDTVMSNQQARAKACANNHTFYGHNEISGTFKLALEGCSKMSGYVFEDGSELYVWSDDNGEEHKYTEFYSFIYECAKYDVTQHTANLSADSGMKYFGVGFAGHSEEHDGVIYYTYYMYIGADDDFCRPSHGY